MVYSATSLWRNWTELNDSYDVVVYIYSINMIILGLKAILNIYTLQSVDNKNDIEQGNNI